MSDEQEQGVRVSRFLMPGILLLIFCTLLLYRFTSRSPADAERIRAQVMLQTISRLEHAHAEAYGTYLPIDRKNNGEILKLKDAPGRFRYRAYVAGSTFVAVAEADLDGNGRAEVWYVDNKNPEPVLKQRD